MAAAQSQPAGRALPSFIIGNHFSTDEHFAAASTVRPFSLLLDSAVPPGVKAALSRCVSKPEAMVQHRSSTLAAFQALADRLNPLRNRWFAAAGEGAPSAGIHLPLIQFCITHFKYDDEVFAYDIARGMPIAGDVPACATLTPRVRPATVSLTDWSASMVTRNRHILDRVIKYSQDPLAQDCWNKTLEEVEKGWVTRPVPVTEALLNSVPLTPRFAVDQNPTGSSRKIRVIDDFRASGINGVMSTLDTNIPESLDVFLAQAAFLKRLAPGTELRAYVLDFSNAYKHVPILESQKDFASILIAQTDGPPCVATLRSQPFGSRRAPSNWARVAQFLKWFLLKFFGISIAIFVDDIHACEPVDTVVSAFETIQAVCVMFGLQLDASKSKPPSTTLDLLGASISLLPDCVEASIPEGKREVLASDLNKVLAAGRLTPAAAAKLRGRLGFAQSLMFARVGRAHLSPFSDRQYTKIMGTRYPLPTDLRCVIRWWIAVLGVQIPRRVSFDLTAQALLYTDASGAGHLGATLFVAGTEYRANTHLPEWFAKRKEQIAEYELAGCVLGLCMAVTLFPGIPIMLCCDNEGAKGVIIRGSCKTATGRSLSSVFWLVAATFANPIWVEFVKSKCNLADKFSRMRKAIPKESRAPKESGHVGIPTLFHRIFKSKEALNSAQFTLPICEYSFGPEGDCPKEGAPSQGM